MSKIVHGIDTPSISGPMMKGMPNSVQYRIPQPHIRRLHIDFCTQRASSIGELTGPHSFEERFILIGRTLSKRAALACDSVAVGILRRQVVDVGFPYFYQPEREFEHLVKVIRSVKRLGRDRALG